MKRTANGNRAFIAALRTAIRSGSETAAGVTATVRTGRRDADRHGVRWPEGSEWVAHAAVEATEATAPETTEAATAAPRRIAGQRRARRLFVIPITLRAQRRR